MKLEIFLIAIILFCNIQRIFGKQNFDEHASKDDDVLHHFLGLMNVMVKTKPNVRYPSTLKLRNSEEISEEGDKIMDSFDSGFTRNDDKLVNKANIILGVLQLLNNTVQNIYQACESQCIKDVEKYCGVCSEREVKMMQKLCSTTVKCKDPLNNLKLLLARMGYL